MFAGKSAVAEHGAKIEARLMWMGVAGDLGKLVELRLQERLQRELAYR